MFVICFIFVIFIVVGFAVLKLLKSLTTTTKTKKKIIDNFLCVISSFDCEIYEQMSLYHLMHIFIFLSFYGSFCYMYISLTIIYAIEIAFNFCGFYTIENHILKNK